MEELKLQEEKSARSVITQNAHHPPEVEAAPKAMVWFAPRTHVVEHVPRGTFSVRRSRAHGCCLSLRGLAGFRRLRSNPDPHGIPCSLAACMLRRTPAALMDLVESCARGSHRYEWRTSSRFHSAGAERRRRMEELK